MPATLHSRVQICVNIGLVMHHSVLVYCTNLQLCTLFCLLYTLTLWFTLLPALFLFLWCGRIIKARRTLAEAARSGRISCFHSERSFYFLALSTFACSDNTQTERGNPELGMSVQLASSKAPQRGALCKCRSAITISIVPIVGVKQPHYLKKEHIPSQISAYLRLEDNSAKDRSITIKPRTSQRLLKIFKAGSTGRWKLGQKTSQAWKVCMQSC